MIRQLRKRNECAKYRRVPFGLRILRFARSRLVQEIQIIYSGSCPMCECWCSAPTKICQWSLSVVRTDKASLLQCARNSIDLWLLHFCEARRDNTPFNSCVVLRPGLVEI